MKAVWLEGPGGPETLRYGDRPDPEPGPGEVRVRLAGLTAWRGLFTRGQLRAGETLLVTGIGGGVATFGLTFGLMAGATVYVSSGDDAKLARAVKLGAAAGVNYRTEPEWSKTV